MPGTRNDIPVAIAQALCGVAHSADAVLVKGHRIKSANFFKRHFKPHIIANLLRSGFQAGFHIFDDR